MAVGGVVKGIKTAAKVADDTPLLDDIVNTFSGFKPGKVDEVEEIDIGATPLPGGQQELYDDILGSVIEEETEIKLKSFEDILMEEVEKVDTPTLGQQHVDELSVLSGAGKTSGYEVDQVLAEALGHDFKPNLDDIPIYLKETYGLNNYVIEDIKDLYGSGLITGAEIDKVAEKKLHNLGQVYDQILEDIKTYPHTPDSGLTEAEIKSLADDVFNDDMNIGDVKTLIESKVLDADKADFDEGALDWISMKFDDDTGIGFSQKSLDTIGGDWAGQLFKLHEAEIIDDTITQDFLTATLKVQKAEMDTLTDEQAAIFDKVTDYFDIGVDSVITSGVSDTAELVLDMNRPNSPSTVEDFIRNAVSSQQEDFREMVRHMSDDEQRGLAAMTFIRGGHDFLTAPANIRRKGRDTYQWPSEDAMANLTDYDLAALNFYTQRGDKVMNEALRKGADLEGTDLGEAMKGTIQALDRLPSWDLEDSPVLYRRVNDTNVRLLFENMEIGQEYSEKAFMSTTHKKVLKDPEDPKTAMDSLVYVIKPKENGNGKAIELTSEFEHENEVLFKPGSKFRLVRRESVPESEGWKRTVVFIEEI